MLTEIMHIGQEKASLALRGVIELTDEELVFVSVGQGGPDELTPSLQEREHFNGL